MTKKKNNTMYWILGIALIAVFYYGGTHGWFKSSFSVISPNQTIQPDNNQPVLSSCSALCSQEGFSNFLNSITNDGSDCQAGSNFYKYGYPNQAPLLKCCCWNTETPTGTCVDSDGDNRDTVGHVTYNGEYYYDKCLDVGQAVTEYICTNGRVASKNWMCDYGEICMQTRSGGHCIPAPHVWNPGDTVFQNSGSGSITGGTLPVGSSLDLSDYGLTPGGNCLLGVQMQTSWVYGTGMPTCSGIQGVEGLKWDLYDSQGLKYSRVDPNPVALGVDLHPTQYVWVWDGQTDWRATVSKTLGLPACNIDYEYSIKIYIYSCS